MGSVTTELVPPVRLGKMLRESREERGFSVSDLAVLHNIDMADLAAIEAGLATVDHEKLELLQVVYGVDVTEMVPHRTELIIDLDEGTIHTAERTVQLARRQPVDELLTRYLALVHTLRGVPVGSPLALRDVDIDVLATALQIGTTQIETTLHELMGNPGDKVGRTARRLRKSVVVPMAGLLVGLTAVGGLVLVRSSGDFDVMAPGGGPRMEIAIGIPQVLERDHVPSSLEVEIGNAVTTSRPSVPSAQTLS
ncbi:MAG: helix-turn-helix transcriptional regulator [Acidimicrobiales bacterium]|nr:helix-turn-helix transcriptional regulator [Acidimicrobiales bacterium]